MATPPRTASTRTACITGSSAGLGAEFARQLAAAGYGLILVARRLDRLEALAASLRAQWPQLSVECLACDLADPVACQQLADQLAARSQVAGSTAAQPAIDLLVNNAGFGTKGLFHEADLDGQLAMHNLHVMATVRLTRALLPGMIARGHGGIINVSSVAGFSHSAQNVSYCATKHWMNSFTEGLCLELASLRSPVRVQALCPGFTYTEFHDVLGVDRNRIPASLWLQAKDVVAESLRELPRGTLFVVPNWKYRWFTRLFPLLPLSLRLWAQARQPHKKMRES